jgi:hypothetical protein
MSTPSNIARAEVERLHVDIRWHRSSNLAAARFNTAADRRALSRHENPRRTIARQPAGIAARRETSDQQ